MFLGTGHEQAHAPPYAQNIGAHLLVFKDFIAKYDVKNVEFFALAAPAGWDVPKRTVGFGQSGAFGEADISQTGRIHPAQRLTLALSQYAFRDFWSPEVSAAVHALFTVSEQPTTPVREAVPRPSELGRRSSGASFSAQSFQFDSVSMASSEVGPSNWATYEGKAQEFDRQSWISTESGASVADHGAH
jgi:hypothetical protein